MGTPFTSTSSSARIRIYFFPSMTRVSIRSLRCGFTRMVTSGVRSSNCLTSIRLPGQNSASSPNSAAHCPSNACVCSSEIPQDWRIVLTSCRDTTSGSGSLFALCSSIRSLNFPCTACTTSRRHSASSVSSRIVWNVSFCACAGIGSSL